MALTEAEEKAFKDALPSLGKLGDIAKAIEQFPGWLKRVESEVDTLKAAKPKTEEKKPEEKPPENKPDANNNAALEAVKRLETELQNERNRNAVIAAVGKKTWFDSEIAVNDILTKAKVVDGKLVVPSTRDVGGVQLPVNLSLDEAVEAFATSKPFLIKQDVKQGLGAGGNSTQSVSADAKYEDLMKQGNEKALIEFQEKYPDKWAAMDNAAIQAALQRK